MSASLDDRARAFVRRGWRGAARAALVLGSACAAATWGIGPAASVAAVAMIVGLSVGIMVDIRTVRLALHHSAVAVGVLLTAGAVLGSLAWTDALLLVPLVAAGWLLVATPGPPEEPDTTRKFLERPDDLPAFPDPESELELLHALSDDELCRQWRFSFTALADAGTPGLRADVVRARQLYLDEIERRHPQDLQAWLASGARAAGNPMPFLGRGSGSGVESVEGPADSAPGDGRP
jgi:hypothetical protein